MLLLDTCTLLWLATDQKSLSKKAVTLISMNAGRLYISSITSFEIAIKHNKKRLVLPLMPEEWIPAILKHHGILEIPMDSEIAILSASLPPLHNDPADRIIIATSIINNIPILTPDTMIKKYPEVEIKW